LQDKLKQDLSWNAVSRAYDPLELYTLIEKTILKTTDNQYPFASVHEQMLAVLSTKQGTLTNAQWYEQFNTRYEVAKSVGDKFNCLKVLCDYCANLISPGSSFNDLDF